LTSGALDQKTKLFIALTLDAAHRAGQGCIYYQPTKGPRDNQCWNLRGFTDSLFAFGNSILVTSSSAFSNKE